MKTGSCVKVLRVREKKVVIVIMGVFATEKFTPLLFAFLQFVELSLEKADGV